MKSCLFSPHAQPTPSLHTRFRAHFSHPISAFPAQCYFIDPVKREISKPVQNGVPVTTICQRLKKKSAEICALRYSSSPAGGPAITRATDLSKLRVKELKVRAAGQRAHVGAGHHRCRQLVRCGAGSLV